MNDPVVVEYPKVVPTVEIVNNSPPRPTLMIQFESSSSSSSSSSSLPSSSAISSKKRTFDNVDNVVAQKDGSSSLFEPSSKGNVSIVTCSGESVVSSDDESTSVNYKKSSTSTTTTNKKLKISSNDDNIISDDSSDDDDGVIPSLVTSSSSSSLASSKDRLNVGSSSNDTNIPNNNHYQRKYEPPSLSSMSKIELSLWRKQQRQQRNRISAAVSRQKQKLRIVELQQQISIYENKYNLIQTEIQRIEKEEREKARLLASDKVASMSKDETPNDPSYVGSNIIKPDDVDSVPSLSSSSSLVSSSPLSSGNIVSSLSSSFEAPFKMISRQAVKITNNMGALNYDNNNMIKTTMDDDDMILADTNHMIPCDESILYPSEAVSSSSMSLLNHIHDIPSEDGSTNLDDKENDSEAIALPILENNSIPFLCINHNGEDDDDASLFAGLINATDDHYYDNDSLSIVAVDELLSLDRILGFDDTTDFDL